jgi:hypothetical protein
MPNDPAGTGSFGNASAGCSGWPKAAQLPVIKPMSETHATECSFIPSQSGTGDDGLQLLITAVSFHLLVNGNARFEKVISTALIRLIAQNHRYSVRAAS